VHAEAEIPQAAEVQVLDRGPDVLDELLLLELGFSRLAPGLLAGELRRLERLLRLPPNLLTLLLGSGDPLVKLVDFEGRHAGDVLRRAPLERGNEQRALLLHLKHLPLEVLDLLLGVRAGLLVLLLEPQALPLERGRMLIAGGARRGINAAELLVGGLASSLNLLFDGPALLLQLLPQVRDLHG